MNDRFNKRCSHRRTVIVCLALLTCVSGCGVWQQFIGLFIATPATGIHPDDHKRHEWLLKHQGMSLKAYDLNHDGRGDVFKFYGAPDIPEIPADQQEDKGTFTAILRRQEIDLNHDSRIDLIRIYNNEKQLVEEQLDMDFDGKMDQANYFIGGKKVRQQSSTRYNGFTDLIKYFENGSMHRIEMDRDGDGKIDTWEYYTKDGSLERMAVDIDKDGEIDRWTSFTPPPVVPQS